MMLTGHKSLFKSKLLPLHDAFKPNIKYLWIQNRNNTLLVVKQN